MCMNTAATCANSASMLNPANASSHHSRPLRTHNLKVVAAIATADETEDVTVQHLSTIRPFFPLRLTFELDKRVIWVEHDGGEEAEAE